MSAVASEITGVSNSAVYSTVYGGYHQRKHQDPRYRLFVRGIHRWPVDSPNKGTVAYKVFPWHNVFTNFSTAFAAEETPANTWWDYGRLTIHVANLRRCLKHTSRNKARSWQWNADIATGDIRKFHDYPEKTLQVECMNPDLRTIKTSKVQYF